MKIITNICTLPLNVIFQDIIQTIFPKGCYLQKCPVVKPAIKELQNNRVCQQDQKWDGEEDALRETFCTKDRTTSKNYCYAEAQERKLHLDSTNREWLSSSDASLIEIQFLKSKSKAELEKHHVIFKHLLIPGVKYMADHLKTWELHKEWAHIEFPWLIWNDNTSPSHCQHNIWSTYVSVSCHVTQPQFTSLWKTQTLAFD